MKAGSKETGSSRLSHLGHAWSKADGKVRPWQGQVQGVRFSDAETPVLRFLETFIFSEVSWECVSGLWVRCDLSSKAPFFVGPSSSLQHTLEPLDLPNQEEWGGPTSAVMGESLAVRERNSQLLCKHTHTFHQIY